jgi:microcompartment protein CcmL/EutN
MIINYPAIAVLEFSGIAPGILAGDAIVKCAPITVLKAGTVHNGKYLILIGGSVAAVEEGYLKGLMIGADEVVDHVILPDVHEQVHGAILGIRNICSADAIGIFETATVSATIKSADAGIKGAEIDIVEIRIADDLGGKAFSIFSGKVEEVEIALKIAQDNSTDIKFWRNHTIIPNLHLQMANQIDQSTYFAKNTLLKLEGGEI